jgi:UDP-N-acetylglucosamine 2-epimerase (non-hydrolysing)/GDP/UDP-N,N'-diacetylbacillosamine 2-epimerase (hydrolysing)
LGGKLFLVTFHPTTLDAIGAQQQCNELFAALDHFQNDCSILITKANADTGGREINRLLADYVHQRDNAMLVSSLGQQQYYSVMAAADVVIGNSSSGLYEAPTLKTPTVNIGDRQKGRLRARSVLDCAIERNQIIDAIGTAMTKDCSNTANPYGDGHATAKIMAVLRDFANKDKLRRLVTKHFYRYD